MSGIPEEELAAQVLGAEEDQLPISEEQAAPDEPEQVPATNVSPQAPAGTPQPGSAIRPSLHRSQPARRGHPANRSTAQLLSDHHLSSPVQCPTI
ncbi:uncharacterized protein LOC125946831 isoform X2 [Dermacentor silvarum]|uniref:uncharacterized protein LOC125946831 isoform X2 n=1 Tax=Dermacentor silvarum TaxID=543639 RepID=UPI002100B932|nr:uncharacterized protein LOC125946831 isoform X2 [Dermacentor silvarum]